MSKVISYSAIIRDPKTGLGHTVVSADGTPVGIVAKHGSDTYTFMFEGTRSPFCSRGKVIELVNHAINGDPMLAKWQAMALAHEAETQKAEAEAERAEALREEAGHTTRKAKLTVRMEDGGKVAGPKPTNTSLRLTKAQRASIA